MIVHPVFQTVGPAWVTGGSGAEADGGTRVLVSRTLPNKTYTDPQAKDLGGRGQSLSAKLY